MLDALRSLVRAEEGEAAESARLHRLDGEVAELRARVEALAAFFATASDEERLLREAEDDARAVVARRRAELAHAEAELERTTGDVDQELVRLRVERARDHVDVAVHELERTAEERVAFDRRATELTRELPRLHELAAELTAEIPDAAPPGDDLIEWASQNHAALFVAAGQVDTRRERLIREANELATSILGESTHGSTPAQALARVERYWESSPGHVSESR
jgi:chromosome segregation ATPase